MLLQSQKAECTSAAAHIIKRKIYALGVLVKASVPRSSLEVCIQLSMVEHCLCLTLSQVIT